MVRPERFELPSLCSKPDCIVCFQLHHLLSIISMSNDYAAAARLVELACPHSCPRDYEPRSGRSISSDGLLSRVGQRGAIVGQFIRCDEGAKRREGPSV
jgi:hypothetical protein